MDDKSITLNNKDTYDISGDTKVDVKADEAIGQQVIVEYTEGTKDAVHIYYAPEAGKALGEEQSGMGVATKIAIILALIAIAIAVVVVVLRNRRKTA
jgi:subtilase family serine protease